MGYLDFTNIKQEFLVFLRNSDIFSVGTRGVTTITEEFNGDSSEVDFTLSNTNVKNVRSITVDGVVVAFGSGYTVNYSTAVVTFTSAPAIGTDNVDIQYDYGSADKIYPDFPRPDLTLGSFPRIGFDIIGLDSADVGFGNAMSSNITFQINVYATKGEDTENYLDVFRQKIIDGRDSFYYMRRLVPVGTGPMIKSNFGSDKIVQKSIDVISILNYEIN